jgi:hypothetical protein
MSMKALMKMEVETPDGTITNHLLMQENAARELENK